MFCLTRTGACPARGVWPRGATELPVGTDDDGTSALRSLRAASGRRAVVRLFLSLCGQLVLKSCFVHKGRTGLNADSSRSHFIVGLCVETGEFILTFVRAIRVNDGVFCVLVYRRVCVGTFSGGPRGVRKGAFSLANTQIPPKYNPNTFQGTAQID